MLSTVGGGDRLRKRNRSTATGHWEGKHLTLSGSTIVVVLGTPNGATGTVTTPTTATWNPNGSAYDPAGNAVSTTSVTESGPADVQF